MKSVKTGLKVKWFKKMQVTPLVGNRKLNLGFCSLNEGGTEIKVANVLKD